MNKFDIHFIEQEEVDTNSITEYYSKVLHNDRFTRYTPLYKYVKSKSPFCFRTGWIQVYGNIVSGLGTSDLVAQLKETDTSAVLLFATVRTFENNFKNYLTNKGHNYTTFFSSIKNGYHTKIKLFLKKGNFSSTLIKYNVSKKYPKKEDISLQNSYVNDFKNIFYKKKEIRMVVKSSGWTDKNNDMAGVQLYVPILEVRYPDQKVTDMAESIEQKNCVNVIDI